MTIPHVLPYQGSKRRIAENLSKFIPLGEHKRLVEPFAGSAAFTLYCAKNRLFERYVIGECWAPLADFWKSVIEDPTPIIDSYTKIWNKQRKGDAKHNQNLFFEIRDEFNKTPTCDHLYFLISKCVKNSVRFNSMGEFNQSCDNRRLGTNPQKVVRQLHSASNILSGVTDVYCSDYEDILKEATTSDLIYLDPPWLGVTKTKDKRYFEQLDMERFIKNLHYLNDSGIDFLLSFDGSKGGVSYFDGFPPELNLKRVEINSGLSAQSLLNGHREFTIESLYLSSGLEKKLLKSRNLG